jgi:hypothetical protein
MYEGFRRNTGALVVSGLLIRAYNVSISLNCAIASIGKKDLNYQAANNHLQLAEPTILRLDYLLA